MTKNKMLTILAVSCVAQAVYILAKNDQTSLLRDKLFKASKLVELQDEVLAEARRQIDGPLMISRKLAERIEFFNIVTLNDIP